MNFFRRPAPQIADADVHRFDLEGRLREVLKNEPPVPRPANEFAPRRAEFSLDRVQDFFMGHIDELDATLTMLADQAEELRARLADVDRRRAVTQIAHDTCTETLAKLRERAAALDAPREEPAEQADGS